MLEGRGNDLFPNSHSRITWPQAPELSISNSLLLLLLLSSHLLWFFFYLKISQLAALMCFPASPWAANWPLLSNLPPVCSLTFRSLYSSSLLVSLTAFSHDVVVCSELPAKVTQMLGVKIQPGIRARAEPSQGSLPWLKFKTASPHLHRNDIKYSLASICLLISLPAIKKNKVVSYFYILRACKYFLRHAHAWWVASFTLRWHLQRFWAQLSWQEPRYSFWAVDGLEGQDQIWWMGLFLCRLREHLGREAHVFH